MSFFNFLLGVGTFVQSLDSNITITQLNRFAIICATYFRIDLVSTRFTIKRYRLFFLYLKKEKLIQIKKISINNDMIIYFYTTRETYGCFSSINRNSFNSCNYCFIMGC